jgi:hypothetical protein
MNASIPLGLPALRLLKIYYFPLGQHKSGASNNRRDCLRFAHELIRF